MSRESSVVERLRAAVDRWTFEPCSKDCAECAKLNAECAKLKGNYESAIAELEKLAEEMRRGIAFREAVIVIGNVTFPEWADRIAGERTEG